MKYNRYTSHTVNSVTVHLVWVTKYRYRVLRGDVQLRIRELIKQVCNVNDIKIIKGVVSADHVHMHVSYPPKLSISEMVRKIKGRTGRKILQEYPHLKKRYWGGHFWAIGYGAWSTGNITDDMIDEYLEHHRDENENSDNDFILQ